MGMYMACIWLYFKNSLQKTHNIGKTKINRERKEYQWHLEVLKVFKKLLTFMNYEIVCNKSL